MSTNGRLKTNNCRCQWSIKHISILRAMGAGSSQDVYPASMNYFDTVSSDLTRIYLFFYQFCHLHFSRSGCRIKSEKMFYLFLFFRHDFIDTVCKTTRVHSLFYRLPRGGYRTCSFYMITFNSVTRNLGVSFYATLLRQYGLHIYQLDERYSVQCIAGNILT